MIIMRDYIVHYIVSKGMWTGTGERKNRRFMSSGEVVRQDIIKITANNPFKAKDIAYQELKKTILVTEHLKILYAKEIPPKKEQTAV